MAGSTLLAFVEDVVNIGAGCTRVTVGIPPPPSSAPVRNKFSADLPLVAAVHFSCWWRMVSLAGRDA